MREPKIERTEDRQLPRWVYALINSKVDPSAAETFDDSPKLRGENQVKANTFYKIRQERLRDMAELQGTSRRSGLEWKHKPQSTFSKAELDKIMPTRRASYVAAKTGIVSVIMVCVLIGVIITGCMIAAACAEIKLGGNFGQALTMFVSNPSAYITRVNNALKPASDN